MYILLLLLAVLPMNAQAYTLPEDFLSESDIYVDAPPNARGAEAAKAAQEAEYDAREAEAEAMNEDDLHESAPDDNLLIPDDEEEMIDWPTDDRSAEERRDERILQRVEDLRDDGVVLHAAAGDEPLHGGAPLTPTGSGTILAILTIAAAIGLTLRIALKAAIR